MRPGDESDAVLETNGGVVMGAGALVVVPVVHTTGAHQIRTLVENDQPYVLLADLCRELDLQHSPSVIRSLREADEKGVVTNHPLAPREITRNTRTPGGVQSAIYICEAWVYRVIVQSRKPQAEPLMRWVTEEVLPTIRRTGQYAPDIPTTLPDALEAYAATLRREAVLTATNQRLLREHTEMQPKAEFYDTVTASADWRSVGDAAKALNEQVSPRKKLGRDLLYARMRSWGLVMPNSTVAYQRYIDAGYFRVVVVPYPDGAGGVQIHRQTLVSQRGLAFLARRLRADEAAS